MDCQCRYHSVSMLSVSISFSVDIISVDISVYIIPCPQKHGKLRSCHSYTKGSFTENILGFWWQVLLWEVKEGELEFFKVKKVSGDINNPKIRPKSKVEVGKDGPTKIYLSCNYSGYYVHIFCGLRERTEHHNTIPSCVSMSLLTYVIVHGSYDELYTTTLTNLFTVDKK